MKHIADFLPVIDAQEQARRVLATNEIAQLLAVVMEPGDRFSRESFLRVCSFVDEQVATSFNAGYLFALRNLTNLHEVKEQPNANRQAYELHAHELEPGPFLAMGGSRD